MLSASLLPAYRQLAHRVRLARGTSLYRPLLRRHRVIFIHIPKTGGQSICQALFGNPDYVGHVPLHLYERESPALFRACLKFTVVRHPLARLLSAYAYLMADSTHAADITFRDQVLRRYADFTAFIRHGLATDPEIQTWWHFRPQISFLRTEAGPIGVDVIGRFETLGPDFAALRARLGFGDPLPWLNRSRPLAADHPPQYTAETRAIATAFYREDFAAFGYQPS